MGRKERQQKSQLVALSSVGLMFPISIAIGYYIGKTLDRWFHTGNKLMMFFVVCGIVAAFINLFKEVSNYNKMNEDKQDGPGKEPDEGKTDEFKQ